LARNCPTAGDLPHDLCGVPARAGVDSAWGQEKPEARKMPENAAESHTSGAHFVGRLYAVTLFPR